MGRVEPAAGGGTRFGSFGRFAASGAFNTLATYLLYLALLNRLSYRLSFSIAYAAGIGLAYLMNRYLVFRQPGGRRGPLLVALIYLGQYFLNLALVTACVKWLSAPPALAPLFAIAVTLPLTYLLNRRVFGAGTWSIPPVQFPRSVLTAPLYERIAIFVLLGLPILSLMLNAITWLRYGIDLPFFDDWRGYESGEIDSFDLPHLFKAQNDTLTPIGYALDALAQRSLGGNSVAYQFLSMSAVLGMLLLLQWELLRAALRDRLQAALCFVFTLLMLQPGSYWGYDNLAYQQALPLVFILLALWLAVTSPWPARWNVLVIFGLGLLSGFTYISGAFGALAAGAALMLMAWLPRERRWASLLAGASLAVAGAVMAGIQVVYAIAPASGGTHAGPPLALPVEANFWLYYLGKIGRSLLLPEGDPRLSIILVLLVVVVLLTVTVLCLGAMRSTEPLSQRDARVSMIFAAMAALVLTYLMLVSAGRANYKPVEVQAAKQVFVYGFQRFHFFWATLLWPWLAAAALVAVDRRVSSASMRRALQWVGGAFVAVAIGLMTSMGAFAHAEWYRVAGFMRSVTLECLLAELQKGDGIRCQEWRMLDLSGAIEYARQIDASFMRQLPILPVQLGVDSPSPWFRLSRDRNRAGIQNMTLQAGRYHPATDDPQLYLDVRDAQSMARCVILDVRGEIKTAGPDTMALFFRSRGQPRFTAASSVVLPISGGPQATPFSFRLEQPLGFENALRLDPVASLQEFDLGEIEVRCRLRDPQEDVQPFYHMVDSAIRPELQNLQPIGDGPGRFRAGAHPSIAFHTGRRHTMAICGVLEVRMIYQVEIEDAAQLFFRPVGAGQLSERNSVSAPVARQAQPHPLALVVTSATGFEDELHLEPVKQPQALRFADIQVRCLKRIPRVSRR